MPAVRRRNHCWKDALQQVADRNGAIEISLVRRPGEGPAAPPATGAEPAEASGTGMDTHLAWRVRVISVTDREILTEAPVAIGQVISLQPGLDLVGVMTIGQNRWMFSTRVVSQIHLSNNGAREMVGLRLTCPEQVERCHRREFSRVSTFQLKLPQVTMWPLMDITSVAVAERANEIEFQTAMRERFPGSAVAPTAPRATGGRSLARFGGGGGGGGEAATSNRPRDGFAGPRTISPRGDHPDSLAMPEVGPAFSALLVNIGGGGIGLLVEPSEADSLNRHRLFWMRIALPPELPSALGVTGRLVHTHMDSAHRTYAGVAFEFDHNRTHQRFIVDQLRRYVELQQQAQLGERYRAVAS